jgi:stage II sporulation protein D
MRAGIRVLAACLATLAGLVFVGPAGAASVFLIRGGGDGHGIGMSQYGAYGYALHGKSYKFILGHYYRGTSIATTDPTRVVRVLLATRAAAFSGAVKAGPKTLDPKLTYTVRPLADGSLSLVGPDGKQVARFAAPLTVTGAGPLAVAGLGLYRGALEFRGDGAGGVETIDAVGLDDYVRGVISREMPASWSAEALKTQAVAARTYAITTNRGGQAFDQYADTRSQVYGGVAAETAATDAAVTATRGEVVTYHGAPAVTYFFNSSGGHTENVENVWPGATPQPWLRGVPDPYDAAGGDPYHAWGSSMSPAAARAKLGSTVKGTLLGIRVTKHGASPRILAADVVGSTGRTTVTGTQLQRTFGLLTTNATFTTISTEVGSSASANGPLRRPSELGPLDARAMSAMFPLVQALASGAAPTLVGSVFPPRRGDRFAVELRSDGGRWRTVMRAALGGGGSFVVQPARSGTYRIVYRGLAGPAVVIP